jgi:hypothetical protein
MRTLVTFILAGALGAAPLSAAPSSYRKPTRAQAAQVRLAANLSGADLERVRIGNQAGILKIFGKDERTTRFLKGSEHPNGGGIDGREWAPIKPADRDKILQALEVKDAPALATSLMRNFTRISRVPATALLGALAVPGESSAALPVATQKKVRDFLRERLQPAEDAAVRRQAVLALAVQPATDKQIVQAMINFLRRDHNAWNTFGVVQFFQHQARTIAAMPEVEAFKTSVAASGSPHTLQILKSLKDAAPAPPLATPAAPPLSPPPPLPVPTP